MDHLETTGDCKIIGLERRTRAINQRQIPLPFIWKDRNNTELRHNSDILEDLINEVSECIEISLDTPTTRGVFFSDVSLSSWQSCKVTDEDGVFPRFDNVITQFI